MKTWLATIDRARFGPWAVVTGASSGIGREFARQLAANGINVVLIARRQALLAEAGREFSTQYGVEHRVVALDLTEPGFLERIAGATDDLDIGLVVSNAGTAMPGEFLSHDLDALQAVMSLNATATLEVTHHFGGRLARRGRGGMILVSAAGSRHGVPNMANDAATKAYVLALGQALHREFARHGVTVSVLLPGMTDTPTLDKLGFQPGTSPLKPMTAGQCVAEGLAALAANRATHIAGRLNRVSDRVIPARVTSMMMGRMFRQWAERRPAQEAESTGKTR
jgi:short-subunit dehydrogenase